MQVLFLTHRLPYAPNRGDRIRAWHILRRLTGSCGVVLASLIHDADEAARACELRGLTQETLTARVPHLRNRLRAGLALGGSRPLTHVLLDSPALPPQLQRMAQMRPPDVVLAYCSSMARFALEPPLDSFPLIIDMVDADSAKWDAMARTSRSPLAGIYRREARCLGRFEALAIRRAHATLVVNEREREALVRVMDRYLRPPTGPGRAGAPRILVVPNGVDVAHFSPPGPPTGRPSVVFCGVMDYAPNVAGAAWLARNVWPLVRHSVPAATLWLVGAHPNPVVRSLSSTAQGIHVTGAVDDVRPYLWNAAVSAAPLHVARGVQNKVLEAVAAGLPVVVTRAVGEGLPPCVLPACRVEDEPDAFATAILDLLALSPDARRKMAQATALSSLTWDACLAPLEAILEEAARAGRVTVR